MTDTSKPEPQADLAQAAAHHGAMMETVAHIYGKGVGVILIAFPLGTPTVINASSNAPADQTIAALAAATTEMQAEAVRRGLLTIQ